LPPVNATSVSIERHAERSDSSSADRAGPPALHHRPLGARRDVWPVPSLHLIEMVTPIPVLNQNSPLQVNRGTRGEPETVNPGALASPPAEHVQTRKETDEPAPMPNTARPRQPVDYVKRFEQVVTKLLIAMMGFVIVLAVVDLAWILIQDLLSPPFALLDIDELLDVFGLFLLVLIGIELLETLKAYVRDRVIRAEVVILVGVIAVARKIVTLEVKDVSSGSLIGVAAIVIALGITYYLIRSTHQRDHARTPEDA